VARVAARVGDIEDGTLPPVCAKTGAPADGYSRFEALSAPGWTWILLLFGILPFLIARYFSTVRVVGLIPLSDAARRRIGMFNRLVVGLLVASLAVIAMGFVLDTNRDVVVLGLAMLVAAILVMLFGRPFVLPDGTVEREWVTLAYVHPRFADEVDRFYDR
jgi:hypothetical protein